MLLQLINRKLNLAGPTGKFNTHTCVSDMLLHKRACHLFTTAPILFRTCNLHILTLHFQMLDVLSTADHFLKTIFFTRAPKDFTIHVFSFEEPFHWSEFIFHFITEWARILSFFCCPSLKAVIAEELVAIGTGLRFIEEASTDHTDEIFWAFVGLWVLYVKECIFDRIYSWLEISQVPRQLVVCTLLNFWL